MKNTDILDYVENLLNAGWEKESRLRSRWKLLLIWSKRKTHGTNPRKWCWNMYLFHLFCTKLQNISSIRKWNVFGKKIISIVHIFMHLKLREKDILWLNAKCHYQVTLNLILGLCLAILLKPFPLPTIILYYDIECLDMDYNHKM